MLAQLLDHLTTEKASAFLVDCSPLDGPLLAIKAAGSKGQGRKVNFIVFENQANNPSLVLKLVRDRDYHEQLAVEFRELETLYSFAPLQKTIPRPLGLFQYRESLVMFEESVIGVSLQNLLMRGKHRHISSVSTDLDNVSNWLILFLQETRRGETSFRGRVEIEERLAMLPFELPTEFIEYSIKLAENAKGFPVPLVDRHGDFWPGNILVSDQGIYVIDWETIAHGMWPFDDLFFFVVTYAIQHQRSWIKQENKETRFSYAFLERNQFSTQIRNAVHNVVRSIQGIPTSSSALFFILFLLDMATDRIQLGRERENHAMWTQFLKQAASAQELVLA